MKKLTRNNIFFSPVKKVGELVTVYTDGSCKSNGNSEAIAGVGVYFSENDKRNYSGRLEGKLQTNNRAEIMAAIVALKRIHIEDNVKIVTDSSYLKNAISIWIYKWMKKGWKKSNGKDVKNVDLFKILFSIISKKKENMASVKWKWVKGHGDCLGNQKADELANKGAYLDL